MLPVQRLTREIQAGQNVFLIGPPGCGKTAIAFEAIAQSGYSTSVQTKEGLQSTLFRASLLERVDLTGCLVPDFEKGITRQLPFSVIEGLRTTKEKVVVLFDDFLQMALDAQAGLMRLFDNNFFSENVVCLFLTNRAQDMAGCNRLCEPLRTRRNSVLVMPNPPSISSTTGNRPSNERVTGYQLCAWEELAKSWDRWAASHGCPGEILAFLRQENKYLYNWLPTADSSTMFADFRTWGNQIVRWKHGLNTLADMECSLGTEIAGWFHSFLQIANQLPTKAEIARNPLTAKIPTDPGGCWFIASVLGQSVEPTWVREYLQYITRLDRTFVALSVIDCYSRGEREPALKKALCSCSEWVDFFARNQHIFLGS